MEKRLAMARRHVREAEEHVRKQEALLAGLARDRHPTAGAKALLDTMRKTLDLMRADVADMENRPS